MLVFEYEVFHVGDVYVIVFEEVLKVGETASEFVVGYGLFGFFESLVASGDSVGWGVGFLWLRGRWGGCERYECWDRDFGF